MNVEEVSEATLRINGLARQMQRGRTAPYWQVTCLLLADENHGEPERVFATSRLFHSRDDAVKYCATIAESRKPELVRSFRG